MKLALVGYGGMGKYHLFRLKMVKGYEIAGVYDILESKRIVAKKHGYKVYGSAEDIAQDETVDAVLIATPNDSHASYVKMFAEAKKHVLCEKPVALNSKELTSMIDAAKANDIVFLVNQNRRYDKDYQMIKEIYEKKILGPVYRIESNVMGSRGIPGDWRKEKSKGGGMILDWGVHLVDQALNLVPSKVKTVYAKTSYVYNHEVDDGCRIILEFFNGVEFWITIETNAFISLPRWQIYGLEGTGKVKNWFNHAYIKKPRVFFDKHQGMQAGNGLTKTMATRSRSSIIKTRLPKVKVDRNSIYKNFLEAVSKEAPVVVTNDQQQRLMLTLEAVFLSAETNEVIQVEI